MCWRLVRLRFAVEKKCSPFVAPLSVAQQQVVAGNVQSDRFVAEGFVM